ncbi:MAG: Appr-1-p processing protein [Candidatus Diapherotrites archaeon]|uniref:Appr-1-p processing protein n=1 Tax=Candidatus Iainarchaeum sp. TaxID=3101447 RepID=A0A2D6M1G6_9ARCH|nr:Appr-1-p processing protein [Candidatus Diapherotrites archaeon]|tara:strand:+ start:1748 stop:2248 length:501 start_codon:yes stop_codon:yes gene_type:complete
MRFKLLKGDIADAVVDAIVNAAGTSLHMGGGVAGALKRKGGQEIEDEALKKAPIGLGKAVETNAGKLSAKYVIHAAAMPHSGDERATSDSISQSTRHALKLADELECQTIAIPAVGCGIAGFPLNQGAKIILREIFRFHGKNLEKCIVVLFSDAEYKAFDQASRRV